MHSRFADAAAAHLHESRVKGRHARRRARIGAHADTTTGEKAKNSPQDLFVRWASQQLSALCPLCCDGLGNCI